MPGKLTGIFSILLLALLGVTLAGSPAAGGGEWCSFSGLVTLDGSEVPDGTVITARLDGRQYTSLTPARHGPSTYSITIHDTAGQHIENGSAVTFSIGTNIADQSAVLAFGETVRLDLTASSSSPDEPGTPTWVPAAMIGAGILLLSVISSVGYIFLKEWQR